MLLSVRPAGAGGIRLEIGSATEVGRRYPANFDVLHTAIREPGGAVVVVADGMGAGEGSALAGRTAVEVFTTALAVHPGRIEPDVLRAAIGEAQRRVRAAGRQLGQLTGCTLTGLVVDGGNAWIAQVGDSRAYRWRGGLLELLTVDHTFAWLGAIYGWYPADSPEAAAARYQLTRFIGHPDLPEPDVLNVSLRPGDVYCLCTDGIAEQVSYQRLAQALGSDESPDVIASGLTADSLTAGGKDNATVAVLAVR